MIHKVDSAMTTLARRALSGLFLAAVFAFVPAQAQPQADRPSDGLLQNSELQRLVDAQVQREAAPLIDALDDADPDVRARAAFALASVQDTAAIPALRARLGDDAPRVRADVAFALGQMPSGVPSRALLDALRTETDTTVQRRLVEALGKTGEASALRALLRIDLPDTLAPNVALAVARFGMRDVVVPEATEWLANRLTAESPTTRKYTSYFFGRIAPKHWSKHASAVRSALDGYAPSDPAIMHLVRGLGRLGDPTDVDRIERWTSGALDWRTRVNAARALSAFTDSAAVRATLRRRLNDPSDHVAIMAAEVLANASWGASELGPITDWIETHPSRWRAAAPLLRGLARQGLGGRVLLRVESWKEERGPVPYAATLSALAPLDDAQSRQHLLNVAQDDDPRVAAAALSALAERWQRMRSTQHRTTYFDAFAQAIRRSDVATINAAAPPLTDSLFASLGAMNVLTDTYRSLSTPDDLEAMTALLRALGQSQGTERAASVLREALDHPHPVIRQAAASALQSLTETSASADSGPPPETPSVDWNALQTLGPHPRLRLDTEKGRITVELDAEQAPQTVQTICRFAREGRYDGVPFHRVIANFVIQGGDFARKDGYGGPDFFIRSEFTRIPYTTGTIGMASAGKDTEGSQYFITHSMQPHLDGRYTAFGTVVAGHTAVDRILANDKVLRATVIR